LKEARVLTMAISRERVIQLEKDPKKGIYLIFLRMKKKAE
jgi:hypothetical protein